MIVAIFIILYMVVATLVGIYMYRKLENECLAKRVDDTELFFISLFAIFFPITYIVGWLMIIIEKIGGKKCKDQ